MIRPFIIGFATTLKHIFKRPITVNYPEQKVPVFPKYRGKQVLMRDENGLEKCVACGLCAVACPADAIYLEAAENDGTVQAGPRYAKTYQIHKTRCIFCGYCEEACPVSAIFMGKDYELAVYSNKDFIWDKTDLLVPPAVLRHDQCRIATSACSATFTATSRAVRRSSATHPEVPFWLCVGDVADDQGRYENFDAPVYWIKGNNENFDAIAVGTFPENLHYIPNAREVAIRGLRVAGLGGTFAPTWYDTPAADLPYPGSEAQRWGLGKKRPRPARGERVFERRSAREPGWGPASSKRRQAPALRARGGRPLSGDARHRHLPDATKRRGRSRGHVRTGARTTRGKHRSTRCWRGCAATAPLRPSPPFQPSCSVRVSGRSGWTWRPIRIS